MDIKSQIRTRLFNAAFGTMVLILASYRGLTSVQFVSDYNLAQQSIIKVTPRVSAT